MCGQGSQEGWPRGAGLAVQLPARISGCTGGARLAQASKNASLPLAGCLWLLLLLLLLLQVEGLSRRLVALPPVGCTVPAASHRPTSTLPCIFPACGRSPSYRPHPLSCHTPSTHCSVPSPPSLPSAALPPTLSSSTAPPGWTTSCSQRSPRTQMATGEWGRPVWTPAKWRLWNCKPQPMLNSPAASTPPALPCWSQPRPLAPWLQWLHLPAQGSGPAAGCGPPLGLQRGLWHLLRLPGAGVGQAGRQRPRWVAGGAALNEAPAGVRCGGSQAFCLLRWP